MTGWNGGPTNTGDAKAAESANGQTNLGRGFRLNAATMQIANAVAALNGRSRMIEKSTLLSYRMEGPLSIHRVVIR